VSKKYTQSKILRTDQNDHLMKKYQKTTLLDIHRIFKKSSTSSIDKTFLETTLASCSNRFTTIKRSIMIV